MDEGEKFKTAPDKYKVLWLRWMSIASGLRGCRFKSPFRTDRFGEGWVPWRCLRKVRGVCGNVWC